VSFIPKAGCTVSTWADGGPRQADFFFLFAQARRFFDACDVCRQLLRFASVFFVLLTKATPSRNASVCGLLGLVAEQILPSKPGLYAQPKGCATQKEEGPAGFYARPGKLHEKEESAKVFEQQIVLFLVVGG